MKTIIAGSRDFDDYNMLCDIVDIFHRKYKITQVVSGKAKGVDTFGEYWAKSKMIPIEQFPADWDKHGKAAGPIRNSYMADYAEALIAICLKESRGTLDMIRKAKEKGLVVMEVHLNG